MKLRLTYKVFETEEQAKDFMETIKKTHRGSITPWSNQKGTESAFIAWYKY